LAQPNLPPPPPPPMGQPTDLPSAPPSPLPPAPMPPASPPAAPSAMTRPTVPPRRPPQPPPQPPAPTAPRAIHVRHADVVYAVEPPREMRLAVTIDPLPLAFGRLSANLEVLLAPHHAVIASPNLLFLHADRGGPSNSLSQGFGFATRTSGGFGIELGYHYFWSWQRSLRGPFFGPSLLLGATTDASVGDPTQLQPYWGVAVDAGWQEVFVGGFTLGGGLGLGVVHLADATAVFPRFLIQAGWSF
jgi:hypothetical protein